MLVSEHQNTLSRAFWRLQGLLNTFFKSMTTIHTYFSTKQEAAALCHDGDCWHEQISQEHVGNSQQLLPSHPATFAELLSSSTAHRRETLLRAVV